MKFFQFDTERVFILDVYSTQERKDAPTTENLVKVLKKYFDVSLIDVMRAATNQDVFDYLAQIESAKYADGITIFLNGHGGIDGSFGNKEKNGIFINWSHIGAVLHQINSNCSKQLIVNATCTCHSFAITELEKSNPNFAKCVIGMRVGNFASPSSADHSDILFRRSKLKYFHLDDSINLLNGLIKEEDSEHPKEYAFKVY